MSSEGSETPVVANSPDYLAQLLRDRKQMQAFSNVFIHLGRILEEEISRVRDELFHQQVTNKEPLQLPEPYGKTLAISHKLYVPVNKHPDFNFVGRILGPRGMTAKQLEQDTGCKIMVRGKGSMRDRKKEEQNRGKPNWEHLNEDLHVLITVEDAENRSRIKLKRAIDEVEKLLIPSPEGEDELKKLQLMELAILNGTYRDSNNMSPPLMIATHNPLIMAGPPTLGTGPSFALPPMMRPPPSAAGPAGAPIILAPRLPVHYNPAVPVTSSMSSPPIMPPPLISPAELGGHPAGPPAAFFYHFEPFLAQPTPMQYELATQAPHVAALDHTHHAAHGFTYVR